MSDFTCISIKREGAVATVSFNRPEKLNTFNRAMRLEFVQAAREVNLDDDIRVVVLTGEGRAFGAGADLNDGDDAAMATGATTEDMLNYEFKPGVMAIADAPKPWVAAINGPCAGVSYSYAMACDLALMADNAFLYMPFATIGLVPDGGATWLLNKLIGNRRAYELMVLGEKVTAEKAVEWGLANRVLPGATFQSDYMAFAQDLANRSPLALQHTKTALRYAESHSLSETITEEARLQRLCIDSEDAISAIHAFFAKETYVWKGK